MLSPLPVLLCLESPSDVSQGAAEEREINAGDLLHERLALRSVPGREPRQHLLLPQIRQLRPQSVLHLVHQSAQQTLALAQHPPISGPNLKQHSTSRPNAKPPSGWGPTSHHRDSQSRQPNMHICKHACHSDTAWHDTEPKLATPRYRKPYQVRVRCALGRRLATMFCTSNCLAVVTRTVKFLEYWTFSWRLLNLSLALSLLSYLRGEDLRA
jgi:hypothetical protein